MDREDVEQSAASRVAGQAQLCEQPRQVVGAAMVVAIRQHAPSMRASVLLVVSAVEVPAPAPLLRTDDQRRRIDRLDHRPEFDHPIPDPVQRHSSRADVAMGRVPQAGLVVENVVPQPAVRVRVPPVDQVLDPALLECGRRPYVGVVRIVAGDELAIRPHAIARIGEPLPVVAGLRAVLGNRETGELAAIGADPGHPVDRGHRQHRLGAGRFCVRDERVAAFAGCRAPIGDALVVPVVAAVVGVQLPVVARGVVSTLPVERGVEVVQLGGCRVGNAVDVGVDRTAVRVDVDIDRGSRVLG